MLFAFCFQKSFSRQPNKTPAKNAAKPPLLDAGKICLLVPFFSSARIAINSAQFVFFFVLCQFSVKQKLLKVIAMCNVF